MTTDKAKQVALMYYYTHAPDNLQNLSEGDHIDGRKVLAVLPVADSRLIASVDVNDRGTVERRHVSLLDIDSGHLSDITLVNGPREHAKAMYMTYLWLRRMCN